MVQYLIVPRQGAPDSPPEGPALPGLFIVMPRTAVITAELLVCTTVLYLVPALQTYGDMSFKLLVSHTGLAFIRANMHSRMRYSNRRMQVFPFLIEDFSVSYHRGDAKINLNAIK